MAQNEQAKRPRGRPRAYEPDVALARAMDAFWKGGYAGTSLDALSEATGMNRPSLYAAFGDKQSLYMKALEHYSEGSRIGIAAAFTKEQSLRDALLQVYRGALNRYLAGDEGARGCFSISTAATEAATNPMVKKVFAVGLKALDQAFEQRIRLEQSRGNLSKGADAPTLAKMASAVIHTLALRARGGESRASLEATIEGAVDLLCGPESKSHGRR